MRLLAAKANHDLAILVELYQTGKVIPDVDRCYPLVEVPDAFRYFGEGRVRGLKACTSVMKQDLVAMDYIDN